MVEVRNVARNLILLGLVIAVIFGCTDSMAAGPNLIAAFFVKGKVGLKWQKIDGVEEYRVYRKTSSGEFELITTTDEDHYFDVDIVPGTTYNYKISILGEGGEEQFSSPKTVTIPGTQEGEFVAPLWVGIRIDQGKIFLNWDAVPNAMAYNIYRSSTPGANYEVVGNSQGSSYADKSNLEAGKVYYYVLTAMNQEFEETPYSEEKKVKFGMSKEERDKLAAEQTQLKMDDVKLTHVYDLSEVDDGEPMNQPADVVSNSHGQIFVTDALGARVRVFGSNGKHMFSFGKNAGPDPARFENGSFKVPFTISCDDQDQIYVSDIGRHDIQVFAADGRFVRRIVVKMEEGMEALRPNGICLIDHNLLAISDTGNHRLLFVDLDGNIVSVIGKRGRAPGEFSFPGEIERSAGGELFVVDVINNRVQVLDQEGNFIREFGEAGEGVGLFGRPAGLALDSTGRVWVSDNMSAMVQSFTVEGEIKFVLGTAQDEWHFVAPRGIHFVGDRMYIVDRLSNKVVVFDLG
jgi:DNA-binding beta-propeller fold protein YncE